MMQGFRSKSDPMRAASDAYDPRGQSQPGATPQWVSSTPGPFPDHGDELRDLGAYASGVLQRVRELEAALATQEWWLLGHDLPEARVLAEEASLVAVVRGELSDFFSRLTGRPSPGAPPSEGVAGDPVMAPQDPLWLYAQYEQARAILAYLASMLPSLSEQAEALYAQASALRLAPALLDPLQIVAQHLRDAWEALGG